MIVEAELADIITPIVEHRDEARAGSTIEGCP